MTHRVDVTIPFQLGTQSLATLLLNDSKSLLSASQCDFPTLSLYLDIWLHISKFHSLYSLPVISLPTCLHLFHASLTSSDPSYPLASHFLDTLALALLRTILIDISDPSPDIEGPPDLSLPPRALFQTLAISVNEATPSTWLELAAMLLLSVGDSYDIRDDPRYDTLQTALRSLRETPDEMVPAGVRLEVIRGLCVLAGRSAGVRGEVDRLGEKRREIERERGVWRGQRRRAKRDIQSVFLEAKRRRRENEGEMEVEGKEGEKEGNDGGEKLAGKPVVKHEENKKMEGKSTNEKMEGKSTNEKMEGKSTNEKMEGKSTNEKMEGKSTNEKMEGKSTNEKMEGKSTNETKADKPAETPANSLSPDQQNLLHSLQLAIHSRDLPLCNVLPRGSSPLVSLHSSSLDETPLRSETPPAPSSLCAVFAPSGGIGAAFAVADGNRAGRRPFLGRRGRKSALFRTAGK